MPLSKSDCESILLPDTVEKKEWPAEGRTINLIWQPANCAKPPTLVSARPTSAWALAPAQDNQLLTRCSHSLLYLASPPSLLRNDSSLKYVCTVCICMYVQKPYYRTWTYQPEKKSHTSLCVRDIHHFASWVRWDKPGSSLFYLIFTHCESVAAPSEDGGRSSDTLTRQAGWCSTSATRFVFTTQIPPPQRRWHSTVHYLTTPRISRPHTDTCHVSTRTSAAPAPVV